MAQPLRNRTGQVGGRWWCGARAIRQSNIDHFGPFTSDWKHLTVTLLVTVFTWKLEQEIESTFFMYIFQMESPYSPTNLVKDPTYTI